MSEQPQEKFTTALKVPPQSLEAEQSVLGGLMLDDRSWFELVELLQPNDFYRTQHQIIFEAMMAIENKDEPLDGCHTSVFRGMKTPSKLISSICQKVYQIK